VTASISIAIDFDAVKDHAGGLAGPQKMVGILHAFLKDAHSVLSLFFAGRRSYTLN
jgi:hypothetical protein